MVDGYLGTMTTEERTLLHLFDNPLPEGQWEAPFAVTQAGISAAVHVQRKHVPRTCLLYTSPSPRDVEESRMPSSA